MALVPVGTVILRDEFNSGTWAPGRTPDESVGPLTYSVATNGTISAGEVRGTVPWDSGINDRRGDLVPGEVIETPGYSIEVTARMVSGAPISVTGNWRGVGLTVYSDNDFSDLEGNNGFSGTLNGVPSLSLWGTSGGVSFDLTDEPNMVYDTPYTVRVDVGTLRQDYYWNGVLKTSTTRTANLNVGSIRYGIGFSYAGTTQIKITAIPDIAPPAPEPGTAFWSNVVGARETDFAGPPVDPDAPESQLIDVPYAETVFPDPDQEVKWFKFVITIAGNYTMNTKFTDNQETDTYLALFDATGTVLGTNEDIDASSNDFRSEIIRDLEPGTYYLGLSMYPGAAADGFVLPAGEMPLADAIVLQVAVV
jgi:hypothetical protein